jgi:hypothetical protein
VVGPYQLGLVGATLSAGALVAAEIAPRIIKSRMTNRNRVLLEA